MEVFPIHSEAVYLHVYFILFQFEASIFHHSLKLLVLLVPFRRVLTSLHQLLLAFTWRHFDVFDAIQMVRDLGLNRIILICIV